MHSSQPDSQRGATHNPTPGRILLVDDDFHLLSVLAMWLSAEGHEVLTAMDGVQALDVAEATDPDLVVADIVMPRMNGLDLARAMRRRQIPIILISATSLPPGADPGVPFVDKPFDLPELSALIARMLDQGPQA